MRVSHRSADRPRVSLIKSGQLDLVACEGHRFRSPPLSSISFIDTPTRGYRKFETLLTPFGPS